MNLIAGMCSTSLLGSSLSEDFSNASASFKLIGRGNSRIENGVFKSKDSYACFGNKDWSNYRVTFKARAPQDAEQVQIWAGFRANNRFDRYVVGLKGGLQDDLYLGRMGYMGTDELLDIQALDFHPEQGKWYSFKIEVCGNRIRVFLNNESLPRIDVVDKNANLAPSGYVTLGGGWIETEFDNLNIELLEEEAFSQLPAKTYKQTFSKTEKEKQRVAERATYQPVVISELDVARTEISLDGNWLFLPDYEEKGLSPNKPEESDQKWHLMSVPNFWNPIRIWLHGEQMNNNKYPKGVSDTYFQKETARCESYTFEYKKIKAAWYRQWVELPSSIKGKKTELVFDAVSKMAEVYVNGTHIKKHVGMFGEIRVDASAYLKAGKNLIAVYVTRENTSTGKKETDAPDYYTIARLDEDPEKKKELAEAASVTNQVLKEIPHGFYGGSPAGIWQPVKLVVTNEVKIEDVFIRPSLSGADIDVTIRNYSKMKQKINLDTHIEDSETKSLFYQGNSLSKVELMPNEEKVLTYSVSHLKPRLWSPQTPNLYDFIFKVFADKKGILDELSIRSGFRTFESRDGLLYLNNSPYWLRGGNHTPFALAPNDARLARNFYRIMKDGNIEVTRTHTTPYNKLWIDMADECGIGISHEGTWPWLMIHSSMPDMSLIEMWADEYIALLKKYRNHPSILFWTINNEMKFYDNEPDMEKRKTKMKIISDVVKRMREIDPSRPICFDSNYRRREDIFGKDFFNSIDDGDIDDVHAYINWYDHTVFKQFRGEFQKSHKNAARPLISQEMSTGYPNNETGHATRFYTLVHYNPQSLIGDQAYAYGNPNHFLKVQSFITGELAEALRRSNDQASGILHFALLTWFRNVYDAQTIEPYPTYYAMKRAMQPVLVSAELWGRNFYAGKKLPVRVCVVNDLEKGQDLEACLLHWQIETETGAILAQGKTSTPPVKHYEREWIVPEINIPQDLPADKTKAKLRLRLTENGTEVSVNEYEILLAKPEWTQSAGSAQKVVLVDHNRIAAVFDALKINYRTAGSISEALKEKDAFLVLSGKKEAIEVTEAKSIREFLAKGGRMLALNSDEAMKSLFPEYINGWIKPTEGDIVNMEVPESPVFDGLDLLELRYFNNNKPEVPTVCHSALQVNRHENVEELACQIKIHGYVSGDMKQRSDYVKSIKGFPIVKIREGKGQCLISTMSHEKALSDPVPARLLSNMIHAASN